PLPKEPTVAVPASIPPLWFGGAPIAAGHGTTGGEQAEFGSSLEGDGALRSFEQIGGGVRCLIVPTRSGQPLVDAAVGQFVGGAVQLTRDVFERHLLEPTEKGANLLVQP